MSSQPVVERLTAAGCVAAHEEADELLAAAPDDATLEAWIRRRERGEPLPWIIGTMSFCGHRVHVDPGVFVPRWQTQSLARRAAARLPARGRAADLCTGAGAVAMHLAAAVPSARVVATDIDPRAVRCARRNGVRALVGDLADALRSRAFDVVTAVAPYVPTGQLGILPADVQRYEPRHALDGGDDGLEVVRRIVGAAARVLHPGGWLVTELGGAQDGLLRATLDECGFSSVTTWYDEDGDLCGLVAQVTT